MSENLRESARIFTEQGLIGSALKAKDQGQGQEQQHC